MRRRPRRGVGRRATPRPGRQHGHVAQAAVGLLELRLDGLGEVTHAGWWRAATASSSSGRRRGRWPASRGRRWSGPRRRASRRRRPRSEVEQPDGRGEVGLPPPGGTGRPCGHCGRDFTPASQIGYQIRSASASIAFSDKTRERSWSRTRSYVTERPGVVPADAAHRREGDPSVACPPWPRPQPGQPGPGEVGERGPAPGRPRRRSRRMNARPRSRAERPAPRSSS
jgi:hypothetical protein